MLRDTATLTRLLRFALVGLVVTVSYVAVAWCTVRFAGVAPVPASMLAWGAVMFVSYVGQKYFTFRSDGAHRVELPRFVVTAALAFVVSTGSMAGATRSGLPYEAGIALAAVVIPLCSFVVMSLWVFTPAQGLAGRRR